MTSTLQDICGRIRQELTKVVLGQEEVVQQVLVALFAGGHVMLEGVPGVAKTLLARSLARAIDGQYCRIQFTPDLMPSDILGTNVFDLANRTFTFTRGPLFCDILLADEINRTPPKTQSALLEAMEERRSTIDGKSFDHSEAFFVVATQNPIEFEGTFPLPEAQLDRFMMKIDVRYPTEQVEKEILRRYSTPRPPRDLSDRGLQPVVSVPQLLELQREVGETRAEDAVVDYVARVIRRTRELPTLALGASPRASVTLMLAAKSLARISGRDFVTPDDVKALARPVLRHRLALRPEAEIEGLNPDDVVDAVLAEVVVPR